METREAQDQALKEYEKTLVLPPQPARRQFILCPAGLVGAGKTTVVKPLSEKLALVRISGDDMRQILKEKGLSYDNLIRFGAELVEKYLAQGYSIAIDSDAMSPRVQKIVADAKASLDVMSVWVHVNPPEEFILNKLRNYKHTWLFKDGEEAVANYMRRKNLHEDLSGIPFIYTFDTSRDDLEKQIKEAVKLIEERVKLV